MRTENVARMGRPSGHFSHQNKALRLQQLRPALIMITSVAEPAMSQEL